MSTSAVASAETVRFYCHTCSGWFLLPAPPSPFHFTLCPSCRQDYLDDSPTPHQVSQPVLPPPPPPLLWPSRSITSGSSTPIPYSSSSPSSTTLTSRSSTTAGTMSTSQELLPPPLPPWLLQASAPAFFNFNPSDCPPQPPPHISHVSSSSSSSASRTLPRTLVSPSTGPSSSSTRPPPSSHGTCDYFLTTSDPVVAAGKEEPPSKITCEQVAGEILDLLEQRRSSSPAVSSLSPAYSYATPTSQGGVPPLPPPPPPWDSPLHVAWDDEYSIGPSGSDYESPPRRVSAYGATFGTPLQRRGSPAAPPPVSAYDASFDTPLQRGGSQAAPAESIAALPTVTVTDAALVCAVCTDPLLASAPARLLPCGHQYHSDCIVTWLSLRNSCPVCRGSIPMFRSTATDIAPSASPSLHPTPPGWRRSLPGGRRIRRICRRLLRRTENSRDRQTNSSHDRQADSSGVDQ